jgi:hypothetical protein
MSGLIGGADGAHCGTFALTSPHKAISNRYTVGVNIVTRRNSSWLVSDGLPTAFYDAHEVFAAIVAKF